MRDNAWRPLPAEAGTLAEDARAAGYATAAFLSAVVLAAPYGLDQGFDVYDVPANEAAVELWDRHHRGEHNLFTRRLYTMQGQQTFDEIRRKYQNDGDFRAAVERYCVDFEKLLEDVSANDRDNLMAQTYLSSDTGKVYTMLAHAAGRLR